MPSEKLPEEFAPTGPKLSRFPIRPAPPIRPHLFPDEARFALRVAVLAGGCELAAWAWLAATGRRSDVIALAAMRLLRPVWARLGTRLQRPAIAFALTGVALAAVLATWMGAASLAVAAGLAAVGDLCATTAGDTVTVERRAAAFARLDMGQALGGVLGYAAGCGYPRLALPLAAAALLVALAGPRELHDRGTPRSSFPAAAYLSVLRSAFGRVVALAALCGFFALGARPGWLAVALPLAGMAIASRLEPRMRNASWLPAIAAATAVAGAWFPPLRLAGMGAMFAAIPAAVARGAGEMERPIASSLAWSALFLGAAIGAVL